MPSSRLSSPTRPSSPIRHHPRAGKLQVRIALATDNSHLFELATKIGPNDVNFVIDTNTSITILPQKIALSLHLNPTPVRFWWNSSRHWYSGLTSLIHTDRSSCGYHQPHSRRRFTAWLWPNPELKQVTLIFVPFASLSNSHPANQPTSRKNQHPNESPYVNRLEFACPPFINSSTLRNCFPTNSIQVLQIRSYFSGTRWHVHANRSLLSSS